MQHDQQSGDPVEPPTGRRSTPRPSFSSVQTIRRGDVVHHVWGDTTAGFVTDRILSSTAQLHVLEYELPPGGEFRHSEMNPTIFGADLLYFVVEGAMLLTDPSTGEIREVRAGEGALIPPGTWHNAFNPWPEAARVVEFLSPPPARGTTSDYARRQPALAEATYHDDRWSGRWPAARAELDAARRFAVTSFDTGLLSFRGADPTHLHSTLADTEFLLVVLGRIAPGHVEDFAPVDRESVLIVLEGELWADVWTAADGYSGTAVLQPGDAIFLPVGAHERLLVRRADPVRYLRGSGSVPEGWTLTP